MTRILKLAVLAVAMLAFTSVGQAREIKVGVILPLSGGLAQLGEQIRRGMELYHNQHQGELGDDTIELIYRDSKNPGGAEARSAAQELIVREEVDMLTGFVFSPNAIGVAPLINQSQTPTIIMNAGTAWIPQLSPYFARVSFTMWQSGYIMGQYAAEELGHETAIIGFTDYPPGRDSAEAFKRGFEAAGGRVLEEIPMGGPAQVPDFTPFFQRVRDQNPDAFYVFVPAGNHTSAVVRTYSELGMRDAGISLIGPGDITQDTKLQEMGEAAVGMRTVHHYAADLDTPENRAFVAAWREAYGEDSTPDFMGVQGYDGMAAIYHVIQSVDGDITGDAAMAALRGWQYNSPRGPIMIDPETRDIVQNERVHIVQQRDGRLVIEFGPTYEMVRDQCKEMRIGRCGEEQE
jgi:branched-chain amino acid transport system substrate-binding protein